MTKAKQKFQRKNRSRRTVTELEVPKGLEDAELITNTSLFSDGEPTFINYGTGRKVKVYLVKAPWSRVVLLSLLYAFAITFAKFAYYYTFGKPQLVSGGISQSESR